MSEVYSRAQLLDICKQLRCDDTFGDGKHALGLMEIDRFQEIRAEIGYEKTDELLYHIEKVMEQITDSMKDVIAAKLNYSTFLIILHNSDDMDDIKARFEKIHRIFHKLDVNGVTITVSIGASQCMHDKNRGFTCVIDSALGALVKAQRSGNNVVVTGF